MADENEKQSENTPADDTPETRPQSELAKLLAYHERTAPQTETTIEETEPETEKTPMQRIGMWFANFWYHYKWPTVIVTFFLVVLAVTIPQLLVKQDTDIQIIYGGPARPDDVQMTAIQNAFADLMRAAEDVNDDGKCSVGMLSQTILTDAQIDAAEAAGNLVLNRAELQDNEQLSLFLMTGEAIICLLDPAQYEALGTDGFLPLAETGVDVGALPYSTYDAYAVRLKDTPFAAFFSDAFAPLPDDTLLCIHRKSIVSNFQSEKRETIRHEAHKSLFANILRFSLSD